MFEYFGLIMHPVPGVPQGFDEEGFDEAVAADHCHRIGASQFGEFDGAVPLMFNEVSCRQAFKPVRN